MKFWGVMIAIGIYSIIGTIGIVYATWKTFGWEICVAYVVIGLSINIIGFTYLYAGAVNYEKSSH